MKVEKVSIKCLELIERFEGFSPKPYICPAGIPTIGIGFTYYPSTGKRVTMQDKPIDRVTGYQILTQLLQQFERQVDSMTVDTVTQGQFDALVSFAFNCGTGNLKGSTLLKKVNANPNDPTIRDEFMKWTKAGGKTLKGLVNRRQAEADLYFS